MHRYKMYKLCFYRSFASHEKAEFWSDENEVSPRMIFKSAGQKIQVHL